MSDNTDALLLEKFARHGRDDAFTELVHRYIHLVYSVALRQTHNPHHAQEITQAVFIILARKAGSLRRGTILSGWLCHAAWLTAANFRRAEWRRVRSEQEAYMQSTLERTSTDPHWPELAPALDVTLGQLAQADRDALVLRYFENKSLQEVALAMGVAERAAQKRVSRALEKLRRGFARRGVVFAATAIAGGISAHSVQAAPAALAQTISATALQGSAGAGSTLTLAKGTINVMNWMKWKTAAAIVAGATLVAGVSVTSLRHTGAPPVSPQEQAQLDKQKAERESAAVANAQTPPPGANKLEDEAKALEAKQGFDRLVHLRLGEDEAKALKAKQSQTAQ